MLQVPVRSVSDTLKNFAVKLIAWRKIFAVANGVLDPNNFSANPNSENTSFTLFIKSAVREESSDPNAVELLVVHGATDAPDVDVIARGVATLVDGFKYGTITDYIKVPASNYILDIADNSSNSVVASFGADLSTLASTSATVLASGFLSPNQNQNGEGFTLIAVFADGSVASLGNVTAIGKTDKSSIINSYSLEQNYPNPFNPTTNINFALPNSGFVTLKVYNLIGEEVARLVNETLDAGNYSYSFNASKLTSGVYFYKINADNFSSTKKMILLK